ncbi:hypothetical protein NLG97_g6045 [Lecanicillium saksenae]|uniref:Uncharacterized protein n=1 Tax=Lecanicillium saksenae TaxID=468837 RepID=A0ACC1QQX2_9HYPO|nr:hypothetical protein NLG97_g6045 [Lecanicillium saksenae]
MRQSVLLAAAAASVAAATSKCNVPSVKVPACPAVGTVRYNKSVPDKKDFPQTEVDLCYTDTSLAMTFKAFNETNFYFDPKQGTNGDIWEYEVMEAFIYKGTDDPQTYLEFEVNPNNVTYQAFVYNPSKDRSPGAPFDHAFISDPAADGFTARRRWTRPRRRGTTVSPETYPDQGLGAWSVPDKASFHISKFFGKVKFV